MKIFSRIQNKPLRIVARGTAVLIGLILFFWFGLAAYLQLNKDKVRDKVLQKLSATFPKAEIKAGDLDITLLGDFPRISVRLNTLNIRNAAFPEKDHQQLAAIEKVYVQVSPWSALRGALKIDRIKMEGGDLTLYTDSLGVSNAAVFKKDLPADTVSKKKGAGSDFGNIVVTDVRVRVLYPARKKNMDFTVKKASFDVNHDGLNTHYKGALSMESRGLSFNSDRGPYLKDQTLSADLYLTHNKQNGNLSFEETEFTISGTRVLLKGFFNFNTPGGGPFELYVKGKNIPFEKGRAMLTDFLKNKLALVDFAKPIDVTVAVRGTTRYLDTPQVKASFSFSDNELKLPGVSLTKASATGTFYNEMVPGGGHSDRNSEVILKGVAFEYKTLPIVVDSLHAYNLTTPRLAAHIKSAFKAEQLNGITGGKTFDFTGGTAAIDLTYNGGAGLMDGLLPSLNGSITIDNAAAVYRPRGLKIASFKAHFLFQNQDLLIPVLSGTVGSSSFTMQGKAVELLAAIHNPAVPASIFWTLRSPKINVADFLAFAAKRTNSGKAPAKKGSKEFAHRLNEVLADATAHIDARIGTLEYKTFVAKNFVVKASIDPRFIRLNDVEYSHAGGTVSATAVANIALAQPSFELKGDLRNLDVPELFTAFGNFGQDAITGRQLSGRINSNFDLTGRLNTQGSLEEGSIAGRVKLLIKNATLRNFTPLHKVGSIAFHNRNFDNIVFDRIENTLSIRKGFIDIPPMTLNSSVLSLAVAGRYGLLSGTDLAVRIPLRNPKKDSVDMAKGIIEKRGERGIVVHVHATNEGGKSLKAALDLTGKAWKRWEETYGGPETGK